MLLSEQRFSYDLEDFVLRSQQGSQKGFHQKPACFVVSSLNMTNVSWLQGCCLSIILWRGWRWRRRQTYVAHGPPREWHFFCLPKAEAMETETIRKFFLNHVVHSAPDTKETSGYQTICASVAQLCENFGRRTSHLEMQKLCTVRHPKQFWTPF